MADANKTEKPTPRRQKKAREQGQIARSRDLSSGMAFTGAILCLGWIAARFPAAWRGFSAQVLHEAASGNLETAPLLSWTAEAVLFLGAPVLAIAWMAAAGGALAQGGFVFAPAALKPQFSRLNPATRVQQL